MQLAGRNEAAIVLLEAIPASNGAVGARRNLFLARAYAEAGRYREAAETLLRIPADQSMLSRRAVEDAAGLLRNAPATASAPESLPPLGMNMDFAYVFVGAANRVLEARERYVGAGGLGPFVLTDLWHPRFASLRKTERFKSIVRRIGVLDYWRARGWPDLCRPSGDDDFECE